MENTKKTTLNLDMFSNVNHFPGLDRSNLLVEGDTAPFVPSDVKILWFRSVNAKGYIKPQMVSTMEDIARHKLCVFSAEVYDCDGKMLSVGYGAAEADEVGYIAAAERRAVSKALTYAGFTWHNGDFILDEDVAKSHLNLYNSFINKGTLDINDPQTKLLYDDALVTILPDGANGYGADAGKPIASMAANRLAEIAQNYGVLDTGDPLVNAKIKFVYMYQMIQKELEKKPDPEPVTVEDVAEGDTEKSEKPKRGRKNGKKSKESPVPETVTEEEPTETAPAAESDQLQEGDMTGTKENESVEPVSEDGPVEQENMPVTSDVSDGQPAEQEEETKEDTQEAEPVAEDIPGELMEEAFKNGFYMDDDSEEPPFPETNENEAEGEGEPEDFVGYSFEESEDNPFAEDDDFDIEGDHQKELHKQEVLRSWGYRSEAELTANWQQHLTKVREKNAALNWADENMKETTKEYVENIPIYNNFLWNDKAEKENVVLLGDFMNEHKDAVIEASRTKQIPLSTLKYPINWYIDYIWDEF